MGCRSKRIITDFGAGSNRDQPGRPIEVDCDERWYIPSELAWLLKQAGFAPVGIFGAKLGAFSRSDALTPDDFEMLAVAVKS